MTYYVGYTIVGLFTIRFFGGRWAWHLAQVGTKDSTIRADVRERYYRTALGRPTNQAYVWGLVVGMLAGFVWPLVFFCFFAWKVCSNERAQDILLPGTNEHYEEMQEQYNHQTRLVRQNELKALEAEVLGQKEP